MVLLRIVIVGILAWGGLGPKLQQCLGRRTKLWGVPPPAPVSVEPWCTGPIHIGNAVLIFLYILLFIPVNLCFQVLHEFKLMNGLEKHQDFCAGLAKCIICIMGLMGSMDVASYSDGLYRDIIVSFRQYFFFPGLIVKFGTSSEIGSLLLIPPPVFFVTVPGSPLPSISKYKTCQMQTPLGTVTRVPIVQVSLICRCPLFAGVPYLQVLTPEKGGRKEGSERNPHPCDISHYSLITKFHKQNQINPIYFNRLLM